jgi:hypothetical protein
MTPAAKADAANSMATAALKALRHPKLQGADFF